VAGDWIEGGEAFASRESGEAFLAWAGRDTDTDTDTDTDALRDRFDDIVCPACQCEVIGPDASRCFDCAVGDCEPYVPPTCAYAGRVSQW
jgi:hypothetical protein